MKKIIIVILALSASFLLGVTFKTITPAKTIQMKNIKKVTGIGGIFFKCKDPEKMKDWYKTHLGLNTNQYGTVFEWHQGEDSTKKGFTQWSPFSETTKYFDPSTKDFMINYRVNYLDLLLEDLKKEGVTILDKIEASDYGKFVHIIDTEGNEYEAYGERLVKR